MKFQKKSLAILGSVIAATMAFQPATNIFAENAEIPEAQVLQDSYTAIDVSDIVENTMPAIVSVTTKTEVEDPYAFWYGEGFGQEYSYEGSGSGVIVKQDEDKLLIITNKHVINNSDEVSVCFSVEAEDENDLIAPAKVNGVDSSLDIAVLTVDTADIKEDILSQLKTAVLGDSSEIKVGQAAIVIGNALGYGQTVTTGIISALERPVTTEDNEFNIKEIQTDAAINPGCSGGALLNSKGEVIGITDAKSIAEYTESMGYAIPVDILKNAIDRLSSNSGILSEDERGTLGITITSTSAEAMKLYGIPQGAYVTGVKEGSAADEAGIIRGDVIVGINDEAVNNADSLAEKLRFLKVGETVSLTIKRANEGKYVKKELEAVLQQREDIEEDEDFPEMENYGSLKKGSSIKEGSSFETWEPGNGLDSPETEFLDEYWNKDNFWEEFDQKKQEIGNNF